jgi:glutamate synthase (NADPH/NADH) small chain
MHERPPRERIQDFEEVDPGLSQEEAVAEAMRCLQCKKPSCVAGCPVSVAVPSFVSAVASWDFAGAAAIIKEENMLPAICGRVCPQESQCEGACILGVKDLPVKVGALERFAADWERVQGFVPPARSQPTGCRVAVVGSGPAGLCGAAELARRGHTVILYESLHAPGGVLLYGIPSFRLPKEIVQAEVAQIEALGVEIRTNHLVGRSVTLEDLFAFDAVLLATGAGLPYFIGIPGEQLAGVYSANEFLTRVNLMRADRFPAYDTPIRRGSRVVVAGGGNVAMDAARVAVRLGASVTLVYRRNEEDLPARRAEVVRAKEEGVNFEFCAAPVRILGESEVTGVTCVRMVVCAQDGNMRPVPSPVEGSSFTLDADLFIGAIGQGPNPLLIREIPGIARGEVGNVEVDPDGRTSVSRLFAAGDVATGAATVILAMGGAKKAALAIDQMLIRSGSV